MLITTTPIIEGYRIVEYHGLVTAKNVRAVNVIRDFFTAFRDFFGGRSASYEDVMNEIQSEVLQEIQAKAEEGGANAIISLNLDFENIGSKNKSMIMAFVKGTAVVIEKMNNKE